jgi:hypothetical protein
MLMESAGREKIKTGVWGPRSGWSRMPFESFRSACASRSRDTKKGRIPQVDIGDRCLGGSVCQRKG